MNVEYRIGDSVELLKEYPENHFDSCVTDPPYGLEFMGKAWDKIAVYDFSKAWAVEVLRVLKPGAMLLAFGGTRTYHRMTCALEDAGFEIRDCMMFLYGSGFPKSHDISKGIEKRMGVKPIDSQPASGVGFMRPDNTDWNVTKNRLTMPEVQTKEGRQWQGWGTALKPAWEPIVVCRKPLIGTVVDNILKHGTGGINVDGCRIDYRNECDEGTACGLREMGREHHSKESRTVNFGMNPLCERGSPSGRWPSNILLDEDSAKLVDEQSGVSESKPGIRPRTENRIYGAATGVGVMCEMPYDDTGGASRFFYIAKASRGERERGLINKVPCAKCHELHSRTHRDDNGRVVECVRNIHPTVKPQELMQYLIRLVTPKNGICLDPFVGSGTTLLACRAEGVAGLGLEKNPEYEPIIKARLEFIPPALETFVEADA